MTNLTNLTKAVPSLSLQHKQQIRIYSSNSINNNELDNKLISYNNIVSVYKHKAIKTNYKLNTIIIPFNDLSQIKFINILMLELKLMTVYTIIFQYNQYENDHQYMLGPQVGINVKNNHNINYYKDLYDHLIETLDILMDRYNITKPDLIVIRLKELNIDEDLKIGQITNIKLNKGIVPVTSTKHNFNKNILPLSLHDKFYGSLLQEALRRTKVEQIIDLISININLLDNSKLIYENKLNLQPNKDSLFDFSSSEFGDLISNESFQVKFMQVVIKIVLFKVFLSNNNKYLIISFLNKEFVYFRVVFNLKTGKFLFLALDKVASSKSVYEVKTSLINKDSLCYLNENCWSRTIGNSTLVLNSQDNNIELFTHKINLAFIKYQDYQLLNLKNQQKIFL